jgi:hypothetical protein
MPRKKGRPKIFKNDVVVSTRIEENEYAKVKELAALESLHTGRVVTAQELIRQAITFVYGDNERLRESFRRARAISHARFGT